MWHSNANACTILSQVKPLRTSHPSFALRTLASRNLDACTSGPSRSAYKIDTPCRRLAAAPTQTDQYMYYVQRQRQRASHGWHFRTVTKRTRPIPAASIFLARHGWPASHKRAAYLTGEAWAHSKQADDLTHNWTNVVDVQAVHFTSPFFSVRKCSLSLSSACWWLARPPSNTTATHCCYNMPRMRHSTNQQGRSTFASWTPIWRTPVGFARARSYTVNRRRRDIMQLHRRRWQSLLFMYSRTHSGAHRHSRRQHRSN